MGAKRKAEKKAKASLLNNKPIEGGQFSQQELDQLSLLRVASNPDTEDYWPNLCCTFNAMLYIVVHRYNN